MENNVKLLIAVGAAVTANCHPCLKTAVSQAQIAGVRRKEIVEAIQIGRLVRRGAMRKMDKYASELTEDDISNSENECPSGSTEEDLKDWVKQSDKCDCHQG